MTPAELARRAGPKSGAQRERDADVARRILEASRRILAESGWEALTITRICKEAGVYRAAVNYYFGGKEGLAGELIEQLVHDAASQLMTRARSIAPIGDRIRETVKGLDMLGGRDFQVAFFESFTHLLRDKNLRGYLERAYQDSMTSAALAMGGGNPAAVPRLFPFATMAVALVDGIIIQQLISPERDYEPVVAAFADILTPLVRESLGSETATRSDS